VKALPLQRICELLRYDDDTGKLYWKLNRGRGVVKDDEAGCVAVTGYVQVYIDNVPYTAHRLVYAMKTGKEVFQSIDHIDGDKTNNLFLNLREATKSENAKNRVSLGCSKVSTGWTAKITIDYKQKHLGTFKSKDEAHSAYLEAKKLYHPQSTERKYNDKKLSTS